MGWELWGFVVVIIIGLSYEVWISRNYSDFRDGGENYKVSF